MSDRDRESFRKALRNIDSRLKFKVDSELADLRSWWERWSPEEKVTFKAWVTELADVKKRMPHMPPYLSVRLEFSEQIGEDEHHSFSPPIESVRQAIECWERGEPYVPTKLGEICG